MDEMVEIFSPAMLASEQGLFEAGLAETKAFVRGQEEQIRSEIENGPPVWTTGLRLNLCGGVVDGTEVEPMGVEWQGSIRLTQSQGEMTYLRNSEEGRCAFSATLTGVASIDDCGDGCMFGREMTVSNIQVEDPDSSNCNPDEFVADGESLLFAQSDLFLGEFQETPFYALRTYKDEAWQIVPDAYSIVFGDPSLGDWFFGVSND